MFSDIILSKMSMWFKFFDFLKLVRGGDFDKSNAVLVLVCFVLGFINFCGLVLDIGIV